MKTPNARWATTGRGLLLLVLASATAAGAAAPPLEANAADRLSAAVGAPVSVSYQRATGAARFVRLDPATEASLAPMTGSLRDRAFAFFGAQASLFGLRDARTELGLIGEKADSAGQRHLDFQQIYRGVPVFAGILRAHFDAEGRLRAVNGTFVPGIDLDPTPRVDAARARERAMEFVRHRHLELPAATLFAGVPRLVVYRLGLDQGVAGASHLAWEVEVGNGSEVREFVYVEARLGKVIDFLPGVNEAMNRRAFPGTDGNGDNVPDAWPASPDWLEGNPLPSGIQERDNMLLSSGDVYARFFAAFGRDSYDAAGHVMDQAYNRNYGCPNASWNGNLISFCPGFTTHDVTAHEWGHAFTQFTHGLIYRWQSGALNEAYSDVWGEAFDLRTTLAGMADTDAPDVARTAGLCSSFQQVNPILTVNSPGPIAGNYTVGTAQFGPWVTSTITQNFVQAIDSGGADANDACEALTNGGAMAGKIAFANRGNCSFYVKTLNAQAAGAVAIVIGNVPASSNPTVAPLMGCGSPADPVCVSSTYTISTVSLNLADADTMRANLAAPINGTIKPNTPASTDNSVRWMMGEDVTPGGSLRDMWTPTCFGDPGKVSDTTQYKCSEADNGGVHSNSGIPNHAFALLVDGGTYNSVTVPAIGMVKAIHLFYRAMAFYQVPATDFADHADALEAACSDFVTAATALADPWGGPPQTMTAPDCAAVTAAISAVELRTEPTFCNFVPMLDPNAPALCTTGYAYTDTFFDWEGGAAGWTVSRRNVVNPGSFDPRDWAIDATLPGGRSGSAFFAPDPNNGDCAADDESGVLVLESPTLTLSGSGLAPRLAFDHNVGTEATYDGGNVKISVNGGPYTVIPPAAFSFNDQVGALAAAPGNTNPMAGEQAWHGSNGGSNSGSWGRTIGNLTGLVAPGQTFKLRYELGTDGCGGTGLGWWVDDLRLFTCEVNDVLFMDNFETGGAARWDGLAP